MHAYFLNLILFYMKHDTPAHSNFHNYGTRNRTNIYPSFTRINKSRISTNYWGPLLYNSLPKSLKELPKKQFKTEIKRFLINGSFYSIDEFVRNTKNWKIIPS